MAKADEIMVVHPAIRWWNAYDSTVKCDLSSTAYRSLGGWVLIDPIELHKEALESLVNEAPVVAIFLTNENHARSAEFYRQRFQVPVWSSRKAAEKLEIKVDEVFREMNHFDLEVVDIPGATEGEVAFVAPEGIAMVGDAIVNLPGCEFSLLPAKYAWNERRNRESLRKLIDFPLEILIFAHGSPIRGKIGEKLEGLLQG
jgi:glyoxylase-like metal-dependent hydrolase (beta-lactamase superfamily II)